MIEGLTSKDIQTFREILVKANDLQLEKLYLMMKQRINQREKTR
jgi:hypothetical protein